MVDISRVKELEEALRSREKLASIGQLAAGIAHEIRNPLSGINLNVSTLDLLCQRAEGLEPDTKERIHLAAAQASAASARISSVVNRIMAFAKPAPPRLERIELGQVVRETLALAELPGRRQGVELREHLPPEPLYCQADAALLEQVLLNLVTNALQAMEASQPPRRLTVSLAREGACAVLRVADTGPGVPEHLRAKILEPFYTTRKDGHGIGLSFSDRIVTDHGGRLSVGASESGGAELRVELPLLEERRPPSATTASS
jgi:C4-dicarboxylate-specific signal transduction histidine kinase